ncbi:MAG: hypothetical protein KIT14_18855 [bacterium]|nr:hypothetical protein [bacterium]
MGTVWNGFLVITLLLALRMPAAAASALLAAGDPSPLGLPFSTFSTAALDADGRLVLHGASTAAFHRDGDRLVHLLAAGDVLPSGRRVAGVGVPIQGPPGCAVVIGFLVGGGGAVVRRCGDGLDVLAQTGDVLDADGPLGELQSDVAYGTAGHVAFTALLSDGRTVIVRVTEQSLSAIVRTGDPAPSGGSFASLRTVGVSATGRVGFRASVSAGRDGLFVGSGGIVTPVVVVGEPSPIGGTFTAVGGATLNAADVWAFRGVISNGSVAGVFRAVAAGPIPQVSAVAVEGQGTGEPDVTYRQFASSLVPSINVGGTIAFRATLGGAGSGSAIFAAAPAGAPIALLKTRDGTPGTPSLVRFRDPSLADDGSLVVPASISGSGPGLFVYRSGAVTTLAQVGDRTDVDTGQERFRFGSPSARQAAEGAVFLGSREGIFVRESSGTLRTLAFVGGPTPLGGTFAALDPPAVDGAGQVAFGAEIRTAPGDSPRASRALVGTTRRGGLRALAVASERVGKAGRFVDFFAATLDSLARGGVGPRGEVAFEATLQGGKTPRGIFLVTGRKPRILAQARRKAPGGGLFDTFGTPAVERGARVAFVAQIDRDGTRLPALFQKRGGGMRRIAVRGERAPGRLVDRFGDFDPPDSSSSVTYCRATLLDTGREGIWMLRRNSFGLLVGSGDALPDGTTVRSVGRPQATDGGVVFTARVNGASTGPGLYRVAADTVPGPSAPAPAIERLLGPGTPSPLGGAIAAISGVEASRKGGIVVIAELTGASARSAILLVD